MRDLFGVWWSARRTGSRVSGAKLLPRYVRARAHRPCAGCSSGHYRGSRWAASKARAEPSQLQKQTGPTVTGPVTACSFLDRYSHPFPPAFFVSPPLLSLPFTTNPAALKSQHGLAAPSASPRVPLIFQPSPRSPVRIPPQASASFPQPAAFHPSTTALAESSLQSLSTFSPSRSHLSPRRNVSRRSRDLESESVN